MTEIPELTKTDFCQGQIGAAAETPDEGAIRIGR